MDYVFIVTYGKSGSTLLMDALNTIPGWQLRGENGGALYHLYQFDRTMRERRDEWADSSGAPLPPQHPWYGIDGYPRYATVDRLREIATSSVMRPEEGVRVTGFKEIRWDYHDLHHYLDFLELMFPGARFIGNVRPLNEVAKRSWWRSIPNVRDEVLRPLDMKVRDAIASREHRGVLVDYKDYGNNPNALRALWDYLGEEFDAHSVRRAYAVKHGTDGSAGKPYRGR